MSINRVTICGRLTRDPEMWSTAGGLAVMGLGVAVEGIELMGGGSAAEAPRQQPQPAPEPIGPAPVLAASVYDDEIPF